MATVNLRFGLDANEFINGVAMVEKQTTTLTKAVDRQIEGLGRQLHQMRGTTSEYERYRAHQRGATLEQREHIETLLQQLDAERQLQSTLSNTQSSYVRLTDSLKAMAAGYISLQGVASLMRAADEYQGLENRLRLVTNSQLELNQAMNDTREIALKTSMQWDSIASIYQRFAQNGEKLGLTMEETAALTDTVAKTAMISGGSMESVNAALVQFGQALASGVLRGEEFNSIAEQQPALLQAIAKSLGVNIGQLRFMAADGLLTADVVAKALQDAAESVNTDFDKMQKTGAQALETLRTRFTSFIGETAQSTGVMTAFTKSLDVLGKNLDVIAVMAFASGLAYVGKQTWAAIDALKAKVLALKAEHDANKAAAVTERYRAMAELNAAQAAAVHAAGTRSQTAADAALAVAKARATAATIAETAATSLATAATTRLAAAKTMLIGAMGGPAGLITAGTLVAGMYVAMRSPISDVNVSLTDQAKKVEELAEKYKDLNEQQKFKIKAEALQGLKDTKAAMDELYSLPEWTAPLKFNGEEFHNLLERQALIDVISEVRTGAIDGKQALQELENTKLFSKEKLENLTIGISKMEELAKSMKLYNQQKDLADGKEITTSVGVKTNGDGSKASLTAAQALDYEAIKKVSDEFALMHANLGLSNEEIKLATMQQNLANLAAKGANAETLREAQRNAELAQSHYAQMQAAKESEEIRKAEAKQLEQNQKTVADELNKRQTLIAQIGKTSEELLNMSLVAAGAAEQDRKKIIAAERLTKEYERQKSAIQTLEDMNREIARLGKTDTEVKLMDYKEKGATAEQLSLYKQQLDYVNQFKEAQSIYDAAVKTDVKTAETFAGAVSLFDQTTKSQAELQKLSKYEQNKAKWEQIRAEEKVKSQSQMAYYGPGAWYPSKEKGDDGLGLKKPKAFQAPNSDLPKRLNEQVKKMSSELDNLGVLYLASQDGKDMAKVLASPSNAKIIKQIAQAGFKDMARDGAAKSS